MQFNIFLTSTLLTIVLTNAIPLSETTNHETTNEHLNGKLQIGSALLKDGVKGIGATVLKPVSVIVGSQKVLTGTGLGLVGSSLQSAGLKMAAVGGKMAYTGVKTKGVGAVMIASVVEPFIAKLHTKAVVAKVIGDKALEEAAKAWKLKVQNVSNVLKHGAIKIGQIILKPIAVIVGSKTALAGAGLGLAGSGVKGFGLKIASVGSAMALTGLKAKGVGDLMVGWAIEPVVSKLHQTTINAQMLGHEVNTFLNPKGVEALLLGLVSDHGFRNHTVGTVFHLPLLEQLVSHFDKPL